MSQLHTYEIVIRGRAGARLLRPFLDDFAVDHSEVGFTRLRGELRDPAHLYGLLTHLTASNGELVSLAQVSHPGAAPSPSTTLTHTTPTEHHK